VDGDGSLKYYHYYTPDITEPGNKITINYKDGTTEQFFSNGSNFVNSSGETLDFSYYTSQWYGEPWVIGGDNYITINLNKYHDTINVPVSIIESPYTPLVKTSASASQDDTLILNKNESATFKIEGLTLNGCGEPN
jgi:hypothetical protein